MRTKAKGPAFPLISDEGYIINAGLNKREYFSIMALQSLLKNRKIRHIEDYSMLAVKAADALIKELTKSPTNEKK